jgi:protease-4
MQDDTQNTGGARQPGQEGSADWERGLLTQLAYAGLDEQRRARRWSIFFKGLGFAYLFALLALFTVRLDGPTQAVGKHAALVDLDGVIAQGTEASADEVVAGLRAAFEDKNTAGVILRINSPGGSPVQAGYINDEIQRLRAKYPDTPLYAVIVDVCASGGYYVAAAADKIYADKASIVGSIGVRMDSFGFVEAIDKLGVERRLLTAGEHKALLDPFLPVDEVARTHVQAQLDAIHEQFIDVVKSGRGARLADDETIFSGLIWTGEQAIALGLVDELGSAGYVAREVIGEERIVDFTKEKNFWERLAADLGTSLGSVLARSLMQPTLN